jgi:hypothetical protein
MSNPPAMPWVKLHTNLLDDSRFARLDDSQKWRYVQLLMLAGKLDAGGYFIEHGQELTENDLAWKLRISPDAMQADLDALTRSSLACKNGHGWQIPGFEDEQGPTQADKRAAWKTRQDKHRGKSVTSDKPVTNANVTPLEIESDIESDKEGESDKHESSSSATTLTNCPQIFKALGATPAQLKYLARTADIRSVDLWAMAASTWSNPKIRKPAWITLQNILSGERASADWYDESRWSVIPEQIRTAGGLFIQSQEQEINQCEVVATRSDEINEGEKIWRDAIDQLQENKPFGSYRTYIQNTKAIRYEDGLLQIGVAGKECAQWLTVRLTSTIKRLLAGITNNPDISVEFISLEAQ